MAADVAKVFRIPGTVPFGDLLKQPPFAAWLSTRLEVVGSIAGGSAVIELTLRNPSKTSESIAVELPDTDDDAKAEVLALRVIAERIEHDEARPVDISISVPVGA